MRVAFLTPSVSRALGGIYEIERNLAQSLVASTPVDVEVVGLEDEHTTADLPEWGPLEPEVLSVKGPSAFGYAPDLLPMLQSVHPDLVHLHALWMYSSLVSLRWARRTGRPHVVTINGMLDTWALNHSWWKKQIAGWLYEDANLQEAACLQVNTEVEQRAVRDYGVDTPVCVIPNGVTLPLDGDPPSAPWKEQVNSDQRVLLFLGRIHPKKGVFELVEAWHRLRNDAPGTAERWTVALVGWDDGGYVDQLQERIQDLDVRDDLLFLGPMFGDEKHAALSNADAFVLPSYSEGLPMAVLEAWSYRLPVLLTSGCNLDVGVQAGAAAETNPEPDRLAEDLGSLLEKSDRALREMGKRGRQLVEERFTWTQVARQMHRVYDWILEGGAPPETVRFE